ncbi:hypothetical protein [Natronolimnohabitans innermongolicus]|uniref:Uncharacterized protein n=1 Tax=Natronolimnohabitans innermongolicus JCM 12255 TaxID=1227499 RepID=L9WSN4_9EURY|nr:hypothetical protein [Natronolimnohabitans innermongolicus]ELY52484.1 hypothetical protein C493_15585 [Natronolimnohabitans innermongolicus JCM 12255]
MANRPPTPSIQSSPVQTTDERVLATTSQLARRVETLLDCRLDERVFEELLLELDRGDYVEWVTVTRNGEYVWDLTDSPDRIAETVADVVVDRLVDWLDGDRSAN